MDRTRARTFEVRGHHYALVAADGLAPGTEYAYEVALDGEVRWTGDRDYGPSTVTTLTLTLGRRARIAFGSCRNARVPEDLATLTFDERSARVRFDRTEPVPSGDGSPETGSPKAGSPQAGRPGFVTVHEGKLA